MARPRKLSKAFMEEDFKALYRKARGAEKQRYLGLHHVQLGKTYDEVAEMFLVKRVAIARWIKRYEMGGALRLLNQAGRGRRSRLKLSDEELQKQVLDLQEGREGGRVKGLDILEMLKTKFHVVYTLSGLYKLLGRKGIVWITGRPIHPEADPESQEAFKKTLPKTSQK